MIKFILFFCVFFGQTLNAIAEEPSFSFMLASSFDPQKHDLDDYYLSEKLDGVRAYWNGKTLSSRNGHVFAAPSWFVDSLPDTPLDGELWGGRQTFDKVSGIVRRIRPHNGWRSVKFMVFELPNGSGDFSARYKSMQELRMDNTSKYWGVVEQRAAPNSLSGLQKMLVRLDAAGGEGFMLKLKTAAYRSGRSDDLLKLKLKNDAEAIVVAHHKGKGRLAEHMGSITVEMENGTRFKIGSGFTDLQRQDPPPIGSLITYKYNGLTKNGKPRFPVFWRIRNER